MTTENTIDMPKGLEGNISGNRTQTQQNLDNILKKTKDITDKIYLKMANNIDNYKYFLNEVPEKKNFCVQDKEGNTLLMKAYILEDQEMLDYLIELAIIFSIQEIGGDIKNYAGETLLMMTCEKQDIHHINILLNSGINIDTQDNQGQTAFHIHCENKIIGQILINKGANLFISSNYGMVDLFLACRGGYDLKAFFEKTNNLTLNKGQLKIIKEAIPYAMRGGNTENLIGIQNMLDKYGVSYNQK